MMNLFIETMTMTQFFLWNPLNVADGEAKWFFFVLLLIFSGWAFLRLFEYGRRIIVARIAHTKSCLVSHLLEAISVPLTYFIWLMVIVHGVDIVCDHYFSAQFRASVDLLIQIIAILLVGWALFRAKTLFVREFLQIRSDHWDNDTIALLSKLASVVILLLVSLTVMDAVGVGFTTLLAFGGVSGLAIAIAAQEIIANFFGSVMIHITRPFRLGDSIEMPQNDIEGVVISIGWYQTQIRTDTTRVIFIPNSLFTKAILVNKTKISHRLLNETLAISLDDLPKVALLVDSLQKRIEGIETIDHEQKLCVWVKAITPVSIEIGLYALSRCTDEEEFYKLRDKALIIAAEEVQKQGAQLVHHQTVALQTHLHTTRQSHVLAHGHK